MITNSTPIVNSAADPLACRKCGAIDCPTIALCNGPHYASARCSHCGAFIKWISQYTPIERQARRQHARQQAMAQRLPSPAQFAYLRRLGYDGPPPATMAEA